MKRNYPLLLISQFLGAFGDQAILAVIIGPLTFQKELGKITDAEVARTSAFYTSMLFIPYVLLAPLAGFLNDRFPKTRWLMGGNLIKLTGTALCAISVWDGSYWQAIGYFVVGIGSCVYSPAKYGILPEILPEERLVKANGTVELLTLVAILTGAITGAILIDHLTQLACFGILIGIYAASLSLNLCMVITPFDRSVHLRSSAGEFFANAKELVQSRRLSRVLLGTGIFWIVGSVMKINFQAWGIQVLNFKTNTQISLLGLWLSVGVMVGSVLAGQLHAVGDLRRTRVYGWSLSLFVYGLALVETVPVFRNGIVHLQFLGDIRIPVVALLVVAGVTAGLFLIPLNAALQAESHPEKLGKTIAAQNFVDNSGMILGGALVYGAGAAGLRASEVFFALAGLIAFLVALLKIPTHRTHETNPSKPAATVV